MKPSKGKHFSAALRAAATIIIPGAFYVCSFALILRCLACFDFSPTVRIFRMMTAGDTYSEDFAKANMQAYLLIVLGVTPLLSFLAGMLAAKIYRRDKAYLFYILSVSAWILLPTRFIVNALRLSFTFRVLPPPVLLLLDFADIFVAIAFALLGGILGGRKFKIDEEV